MKNGSPNRISEQCENVILADADYVDKVVFNLIVNFERMLGRRIPQADLARWIDCVALDGGLRPGNNITRVVLIHDERTVKLDNFTPSDLTGELDGKAFKDDIGEFIICSCTAEGFVSKEEFFEDALLTIVNQANVKRVMVIPDEETTYNGVRRALRQVPDDKKVTVFTMQPMPGGSFRQEILGYSLMSALGIRGEEISGGER